MVTMSALAQPLFVVVPLSSLCARQAGKSCQKLHGRLKSSPFRFESSTSGALCLRALCNWPNGGVSLGFRFDRALESRRRNSPSLLLLRWEDQQHRWTRAWAGQNMTWNEEQSPYETLGMYT